MTNEEEKLVGKVTHFYSKLGVAIVELSDAMAVGDTLHFKGATTDFEEVLASIQVEHKDIQGAKKGDAVGVKVSGKVREGDEVYKK